MPRIPYILSDDIVVPLTKKLIGGVEFDAEAHVTVLSIEPGSAKRVCLYLQVHFIDGDGEHVKVDNKVLYFDRQSVADMSWLVNVATGEPIVLTDKEFIPNPVPKEDGEDDYEELILNPLLEGINYIEEWRFFRMMMHSPVVIFDLIVSKIQYADAIGKFNN